MYGCHIVDVQAWAEVGRCRLSANEVELWHLGVWEFDAPSGIKIAYLNLGY